MASNWLQLTKDMNEKYGRAERRPFLDRRFSKFRNFCVARNKHGYQFVQNPKLTEMTKFYVTQNMSTIRAGQSVTDDRKSTPIIFPKTENEFQSMIEELNVQEEFAFDLEFSHGNDKGYFGHTYPATFQLSIQTKDFIVCPFQFGPKIQDLKPIFENPEIVKIGFGATEDVKKLNLFYNIFPVGIVDIQTAFHKFPENPDERRRREKEKFWNVVSTFIPNVEKTNKDLRAADFRKRPLHQDLIEYARADSHLLLRVWNNMKQQYGGKCYKLYEKEWTAATFKFPAKTPGIGLPIKETFEDIQKMKNFTGLQNSILRKIFELREEIAKFNDVPSIFVCSAEKMIAMVKAKSKIKSVQELIALSPKVREDSMFARRMSKQVLEILQEHYANLEQKMDQWEIPITQEEADSQVQNPKKKLKSVIVVTPSYNLNPCRWDSVESVDSLVEFCNGRIQQSQNTEEPQDIEMTADGDIESFTNEMLKEQPLQTPIQTQMQNSNIQTQISTIQTDDSGTQTMQENMVTEETQTEVTENTTPSTAQVTASSVEKAIIMVTVNNSERIVELQKQVHEATLEPSVQNQLCFGCWLQGHTKVNCTFKDRKDEEFRKECEIRKKHARKHHPLFAESHKKKLQDHLGKQRRQRSQIRNREEKQNQNQQKNQNQNQQKNQNKHQPQNQSKNNRHHPYKK